MLTEIYATLEIRKKEMRFVVIRYRQKSTTVIFKEKIAGEWLTEGDLVCDTKFAAQKLKRKIEEFERNFSMTIKNIILILPSRTLQILDREEKLALNNSVPISDPTITEILTNLSRNNQLINQENVIFRPYNYIIQNGVEGSQPPIGLRSDNLTVKAKIYSIDKNVNDSHAEVVTLAKKEVLGKTVDMFALGKAIVSAEEFRNTFALVNWGYENTKIGYYAKEALNRVAKIDVGLSTLIKNVATKVALKPRDVEKYFFKLIDCSNDALSHDDLVLRKYSPSKQKTIVLNATQLRQMIVQELTTYINELDREIAREIPPTINYKVYYTGRATDIPGFIDILGSSFLKERTGIYYSTVMGASENWVTTSIGAFQQKRLENKQHPQYVATSLGILDKKALQPNSNYQVALNNQYQPKPVYAPNRTEANQGQGYVNQPVPMVHHQARPQPGTTPRNFSPNFLNYQPTQPRMNINQPQFNQPNNYHVQNNWVPNQPIVNNQPTNNYYQNQPNSINNQISDQINYKNNNNF